MVESYQIESICMKFIKKSYHINSYHKNSLKNSEHNKNVWIIIEERNEMKNANKILQTLLTIIYLKNLLCIIFLGALL